jgi:AcrR family transcriptional regulator
MAYRPTPRTEARRAEQRERIVAAALTLVAEGGYRAAQVAAVAAEAGVATGTVYRHFPSKGELLAEVFARASQREVDAVAAAAAVDAPAPARLSAAIETFARRALRGRRLAWALIAEPVDPAVEAERLRYRRAYRDVFAAVLAAGAAAGELDVPDVDLAAAAIVGMAAESLVGPLSPGTGAADADALAAHLAQLVTRSVTPRGTHVRHRAPEPQHA